MGISAMVSTSGTKSEGQEGTGLETDQWARVFVERASGVRQALPCLLLVLGVSYSAQLMAPLSIDKLWCVCFFSV